MALHPQTISITSCKANDFMRKFGVVHDDYCKGKKVESQLAVISKNNELLIHGNKPPLRTCNIVFYFTAPSLSDNVTIVSKLKYTYPKAILVGCTTGGEIANKEALENSCVAAAIKLDQSTFKTAQTPINDNSQSYDAGKKLAEQLNASELRLVFILSDGLCVNGSALVQGLTDNLPEEVIITGGLAGDGADFKYTKVGLNGTLKKDQIIAVGFYGEHFRVSYGSVGGWAKFGPERTITKSDGNILYELDGQPALDLYKKYLGEEAEKLPGSGLLFPLSIRPDTNSPHDIVRTIVGIDEDKKSMTFAGDIPQGYSAQLMCGEFESLVTGAAKAAEYAIHDIGTPPKQENSLGILVSCIGRNLLMGQQVSDEVEAVAEVLDGIPTVGFYSYGEICHHPVTRKCGLHNQTMTITLISEN